MNASRAGRIERFFLTTASVFILVAAAEVLEPPPPVDLNAWAEENIVFTAGETDYPGPYSRETFPPFERILECLGPDHPSRVVTLKKSAQTGGTIIAGVFLGGTMDLDPGPSSIIHPTADNAKTWVEEKWRPLVKSCERMTVLLAPDNSRDSKSTLKRQERRDGAGRILIRGAASPASLSLWSANRQVQDDLSKWLPNKAGDPEKQGEARLDAQEYAKIFKISTPMIDGSCKITRSFERGTQEYWHVPCPHCGFMQPLEWENFLANLDEDHPEKAHFICADPECGGVIEHRHKEKIVAAGEWVAAKPEAHDVSFHIWDAYSPFTSWARIARAWIDAKGIAESEQNFMNDKVGLAYKQDGEAPEWEWLMERADATGHTKGHIPLGGLFLCMGVDVQGDRVEWHLMAFGENRQRWTVDYDVIPGFIDEPECEAALDKLFREGRWPDAFGNLRGLDQLAIDSSAYTDKVEDWARRHPQSRVMIIKGMPYDNAPPLATSRPKKPSRSGKRQRKSRLVLWKVGVNQIKAGLYKDLRKEDPEVRGYHGFPKGLELDFYQQYCAERKVPKRTRTGFVTWEWTKDAAQANEVLDTAVYAEAAARRLKWDRLTEGPWQRIREARERTPDKAQVELFEPGETHNLPGSAAAKAARAAKIRARTRKLAH